MAQLEEFGEGFVFFGGRTVEAFRIECVAEAHGLDLALELGGHGCGGHVEPFGTGGGGLEL